MNFTQVCERSGLSPEAVRYYVESKLLAPLYPRRNMPEDGEYAEQDVQLLIAISNMRRLAFSIDSIRLMLLDHTRAAELVERNYAGMKMRINVSKERLVLLDKLDRDALNTLDDVVPFFAGLTVNIPLPSRDENQDEGQSMRNEMSERKREIRELFEELNRTEKRRQRLRRTAIALTLLLLVALGWIIAPIWMAYLPKP